MANDSLTMADLQRAYDLLKSMPPTPVKIWCIDRLAAYYQIKQTCFSSGLFVIDALTGLPVIDWRSSDFDFELAVIAGKEDDLKKLRVDNYPERRVYPWICSHPGVWVEWNNGEFTEIEIPRPSVSKQYDDSPAPGPAAH